jgi:hypothetical protein
VQQEQQRLVDIILANVGTVVCFRSGSPADERKVLPLFMPFIQQGEITNLPAYSYYIRIAATMAQEPMSGRTVVVKEIVDESTTVRVRALSRELNVNKTLVIRGTVDTHDYNSPALEKNAEALVRKHSAVKGEEKFRNARSI